jgi:hypothetical protein
MLLGRKLMAAWCSKGCIVRSILCSVVLLGISVCAGCHNKTDNKANQAKEANKPKEDNRTLDVAINDKGFVIDGTPITLPVALTTLKTVFGDPTREDSDTRLIYWDNLGVAAVRGSELGSVVCDEVLFILITPIPETGWTIEARQAFKGTIKLKDLEIIEGRTRGGILKQLGARGFKDSGGPISGEEACIIGEVRCFVNFASEDEAFLLHLRSGEEWRRLNAAKFEFSRFQRVV